MSETQSEWTSLSLKQDVYRTVKSQKRGGESFNELLEKMCEAYNPEANQ